MEEEKKKIYTVVALVVVAGLLFSCVAGAVAGGLSGFVAGRRQARKALEGVVGGRDLIEPWSEERPFSMPDLDEEELPFDWMPGHGARGTGCRCDRWVACRRGQVCELETLSSLWTRRPLTSTTNWQM